MATEKQREAGRKNYAKCRLANIPSTLQYARKYVRPECKQLLSDVEEAVKFILKNWS